MEEKRGTEQAGKGNYQNVLKEFYDRERDIKKLTKKAQAMKASIDGHQVR